MKITWLGQAGLLFETNGLIVMIDPYLSESCYKVNPNSKRNFPVDEKVFEIQPDVIILTHNHLDHTDPETLERFIDGKKITFLASGNAWQKVRTMGKGHNYVLFNNGTEFTVNGVTFKAVYASHSDDLAIGVVFTVQDTTYFVTGDTLYSKKVFESINDKIDVVFLPINGVGNNMNAVDAKRFCERLNAKVAVPLHFGLHDKMTGEEFEFESAVIPKPFKEIII